MHVRKSILIAVAAVILLLTAALAYFVGRASEQSGVSEPQVESLDPPQAAATPAALPKAAVVEPTPAASSTMPPTIKEKPVASRPKAFTSAEQRLIDAWFETEEMCRGSPDEASIEIWCRRREVAAKKMNQAGICFGRESDRSAAEHDVHRCGPGSYR